jgi:hypothetical protein
MLFASTGGVAVNSLKKFLNINNNNTKDYSLAISLYQKSQNRLIAG